jgi:hypothetical protein
MLRDSPGARMISIELTRRFKTIVRESGREDEVLATLRLVQEGFGSPHLHAGISIRKLGKRIYECRTGLLWRLIFMAQKGLLTFDFAGDHDEVQNYLRSHL